MDAYYDIERSNAKRSIYRLVSNVWHKKKGLRVLCDGEEILELWSDTKDTNEDVGSICTKYLDDASKRNAVSVDKHNYAPMGEMVFTTYAYHDDWRFKWSIHAKSYDVIRNELDRCISAYKKSRG